MSEYMLTVPEEVYAGARRIAQRRALPVDEVMIEILRAQFVDLPLLTQEEEDELAALKNLSDDALWTIAREQMASPLQERLQALMRKNSAGQIDADEYAELSRLVERGQRLMLRKSEAAALLADRGYTITPVSLQPGG